MPIETICQGCQKRLRVADEHAGKLAKCPHCQAIYTVPQPIAGWSEPGATSSDPAAADRWHLKTPDGLSFGPVSRAELDRWLSEGRVTAASQILHEANGQWVWAGQVYPHLAITTASRATPSPFAPGTLAKPIDLSANPFRDNVNPYASPSAAGYAPLTPQRYREQSRGGTILTLSIVGPFFCIFMSIAAVVMGFTDLNEMKRGVRDPSGRGLTIAGTTIGCVYLGFLLILFGIGFIGAIFDR